MVSVSAGVFMQLALLFISFVIASLAIAIAVRRCYRDVTIRKRMMREAQLRPQLLRALSDDEPDLSGLDGFEGGEREVLESLIWSMLTKVRGASRGALVAWLQRNGSIERACERTQHFSAVQRALAAEHLGAAAIRETSPVVARLLDDRDDEVRIVAARALGKLGDPGSVPALLEALDDTDRRPVPMSLVSMALLHIGPAAVENLVQGLGNRSDVVRSVSADLLGMQGALQSTRWLMMLLEHDESAEVRSSAAGSLGRIGAPQAIAPLLRALSPDEASIVRRQAARALGHIGGREAVDGLHVALNDDDDTIRSAAAEALANAGDIGIEILDLVAQEQDAPGAIRASEWRMRSSLIEASRKRPGMAVRSQRR